MRPDGRPPGAGVPGVGRRLEQAGDDQSQRQIAAALRRPARQHRVERDAARGAERGEHVAMRGIATKIGILHDRNHDQYQSLSTA